MRQDVDNGPYLNYYCCPGLQICSADFIRAVHCRILSGRFGVHGIGPSQREFSSWQPWYSLYSGGKTADFR